MHICALGDDDYLQPLNELEAGTFELEQYMIHQGVVNRHGQTKSMVCGLHDLRQLELSQ